MSIQQYSKEMPMIFVVGNSRSGTTMTGRILNLSKDVFTFHEIHFFEQLWSARDKGKVISLGKAELLLAKLISIERIGYLQSHKDEMYLKEAKRALTNFANSSLTPEKVFQFFLNYETTLNHKIIPCDQTPRNILYVSEILDMYPQARIINLVRDPRDILLSQKNKWRRKFLGASQIPWKESFRSWINYHPITISKLWKLNVSNSVRYSNHPRFLGVRFEDLLNDQENQVKKICNFVGIEFNEAMLRVPQIGSSGSKDQQSKEGINSDRAENWRKGGLSDTEIYFSQLIAGDAMRQFNYHYKKVKPNLVSLVFHLITFPAKVLTSFVLNIHRMKNIGESLRRRLSI